MYNFFFVRCLLYLKTYQHDPSLLLDLGQSSTTQLDHNLSPLKVLEQSCSKLEQRHVKHLLNNKCPILYGVGLSEQECELAVEVADVLNPSMI